MTHFSLSKSYSNPKSELHIFHSDAQLCESMSILLRLEGMGVRSSSSLEQICGALNVQRPNLVLIEIAPELAKNSSQIKAIKSIAPDLAIIGLCHADNLHGAVSAMKLGVCDVLSLPLDMDVLIETVREIANRNVNRSAESAKVRSSEGLGVLTKRERQVFDLISSGHSNKEAGRELGISPRTIEVHRARAMEKLGARNTAELVRIALAH